MMISRSDWIPISAKIGMVCAMSIAWVQPSFAGEANVRDAQWQRGADDLLTISATIEHADEGWDHYADRFEILAPDGAILATRILLHPHVDEQPFTRSLTSFVAPDGLCKLIVRTHDLVHGYGGAETTLDICSGQ